MCNVIKVLLHCILAFALGSSDTLLKACLKSPCCTTAIYKSIVIVPVGYGGIAAYYDG